jgi:hypothetical protein
MSVYSLLTPTQLQHVLSRTSPHSFEFNIRRMNNMYKLPINTEPTLDKLTKPNGQPELASSRVFSFLKTLRDECDEGEEISRKLQLIEHYETPEDIKNSVGYRGFDIITYELLESIKSVFLIHRGDNKVWEKMLKFNNLCAQDLVEAKKDILVDLADWLGDIMVYCRSEAMKFGLPLESVLEAIMGSNFTKLPASGIPIHDENGKFLKDMSNFVPPEPAIKTILFGLQAEKRDEDHQITDEQRLAYAQALIGKTESGVVLSSGVNGQSSEDFK